MLRGSWASRSRSTRLEPMKPAEPVMRRDWVFCDINIFVGWVLPLWASRFSHLGSFALPRPHQPADGLIHYRGGIHSLYDHLTGIDIQLNPLLDGLHGHMPTFQAPLNIFDNPALIERLKVMHCGPFLLRDLLLLKLHHLLQSIKYGLHMGEEGRVMEVVVHSPQKKDDVKLKQFSLIYMFIHPHDRTTWK